MKLFSPDEVKALTGSTFTPTPPVPLVGLDPIMTSEFVHYLQPMLLRDSDAFSMAQSVELRVPFLDDEVVAAALTRNQWHRAVTGKRVIPRALNDNYLSSIARERKTGFSLPMNHWIQNDLAPALEQALDPASPLAEHVDIEAARRLSTDSTWARRWALITLNEWLVRHG